VRSAIDARNTDQDRHDHRSGTKVPIFKHFRAETAIMTRFSSTR
jgi:hypothetical protein